MFTKQTVPMIAVVLLSFTPFRVFGGEPLLVDLNPDNGRQDVWDRRCVDWRVAEAEQVTRDFGSVTVTLKAANGLLSAGWWKAGYDTGATLVSDGVSCRGGALELILSGLPAGKHSLVTWHNAWSESATPMTMQLAGRSRAPPLRPTVRVATTDESAVAFIEFVAVAGEPVVIVFIPEQGPDTVAFLNGFALDVPDPRQQARTPFPADCDEHAVECPTLTWKAASDADSHHVYIGVHYDAVAAATKNSPEFQGATSTTRWPTDLTDSFATVYWRVDTVSRAQPEKITPGPVWRFRVRRLAFPGAEGYGRFAIGGRGGRVLEVTNLDDSGPGSLRAAIDAAGPRTVVFRVGGTIALQSKLVVRQPYLTVAGQTAPGDGIAIRGYTFGCLGTHDVILRQLRIRVGDEARLTMDGTGFASCDHCIMDHCSISWSIDEAVSTRGAGHITVQRCLIAEALNIADHQKYKPGTGHSFAGSISGRIGSFHHNLLAHCAGRNWSLAGGLTNGGRYAGYLDLRNNVVYNWRHRTTDGGVKALNFVNNFYLPGPTTSVFHFVKPDVGAPHDPQQYYISGNRMAGRPEYDDDNWAAGGVVVDAQHLPSIKLTEAFCESHVATHSAEDAFANVLNDVGANWPKLDAVDQRILRDVRERTASSRGSRSGLPGIIDSQSDVGGWPELRGGAAPSDSDHDGLPDAWERAHNLDPENPSDASAPADSSEYTWLEVYLSSLTGPTESTELR